MTTEKEPWRPTCKRFVAFLDILGFKDRVFRDNLKTIRKDLLSFRKIIDEIEQFPKNIKTDPDNPFLITGKVIPVIFSDSILLVSSNDTGISFFYTAFRTQQIIERAISLGLPIKGAIAFGDQTAYTTKSLYFGKPLIDAFELQGEILLYTAALHHTAEQRIKELNSPDISSFISPLFIKYKTPLKQGTVNHYLLKINESDKLISQLHEFYNTLSGSKRCYPDNTLSFLNSIKNIEIQKDKSTAP